MSYRGLRDRRIVVTRSREQAEAMRARLIERGATPLLFPTLDFAPLPTDELANAVTQLDSYLWLIFTSANAVRFFFGYLAKLDAPPALPPIAAIGSATAAELDRFGLRPHFMPDVFEAEALALGLGDLSGQRVLLPRSRIGRPEAVEQLLVQGAVVDEISIYDTVLAKPSLPVLAEMRMGVDAVTFTSPSTLRNFLEILASVSVDGHRLLANTRVACIGPTTAQAAADMGVHVHVVPMEHTVS
ncbi:MAG: uroporphyrinogen-III synthase, partial [Caldilineaceae bacterium]|nr:uroporphyrinogen-III synthase [Caldilineaceae bacterium]